MWTRLAVVLGVSAVVLNVYWIIAVDVSAVVEDDPAWIGNVLTAASLPGIVLIIFAIWRVVRASAVASSGEPPADRFRAALPWVIEYAMLTQVPVALLVGLIMRVQLGLDWWLSAVLVIVVIGGTPVGFATFLARYQITQDALVVRYWPVGRRSLRWQEMTAVRTPAINVLGQIVVERTRGKPVTLIAPADRQRFLRAIAARARHLDIDGIGGT
jgi:hypothetical protein